MCVSGTWQYPYYILGSTSTAAGGTCSTAGALRYNTTISNIEYCNGSVWSQLAQVQPTAPPTAPSGSGYFVMSKSTWNGNLGGLSNANSLCLTELTTNTNWSGYSAANSAGLLNSSHVFAFLCNGVTCNNLTPITTYYFANAANSSAGGASFNTDSNGDGPNDSSNWSAANRFYGAYTYWTGRQTSGSDSSTTWAITASNYYNSTCPVFGGNWSTSSSSSGSSGAAGATGTSTNTTDARWTTNYDGVTTSCDQSLHLICYVNP